MPDMVSSVLISTSYSKYFYSPAINIITDLNNIDHTLSQFLVDMISPLTPSILYFDVSIVISL